MINIRNNTFETNSSSAHSMVLTGNNHKHKLSLLDLDYNKASDTYYFAINKDDYGRGFEILKSVPDKLGYICASCSTLIQDPKKYNDCYEQLEIIYNICKKNLTDPTVKFKFKINAQLWSYSSFDEAVATDTDGPSAIDCMGINSSNCLTSIDHQSMDMIANMLQCVRETIPEMKDSSNEEIFEEFIFNDKYVIIVDDDSTGVEDSYDVAKRLDAKYVYGYFPIGLTEENLYDVDYKDRLFSIEDYTIYKDWCVKRRNE